MCQELLGKVAQCRPFAAEVLPVESSISRRQRVASGVKAIHCIHTYMHTHVDTLDLFVMIVVVYVSYIRLDEITTSHSLMTQLP